MKKRKILSTKDKLELMKNYMNETEKQITTGTQYRGYNIGSYRDSLRHAYYNGKLDIDEDLLQEFIELGIIKEEKERIRTSAQQKYEFLMSLNGKSKEELKEEKMDSGLTYSQVRNQIRVDYNYGKLNLTNKQIEDLIKNGYLKYKIDKSEIQNLSQKYNISKKYIEDIMKNYGSVDEFLQKFKNGEVDYEFGNDVFVGYRGIVVSERNLTQKEILRYTEMVKSEFPEYVDKNTFEFIIDIDKINEWLDNIDKKNPRTATVIRKTYGIDGEEKKSIDEIGREIGRSGSRVSQIRSKACSKFGIENCIFGIEDIELKEKQLNDLKIINNMYRKFWDSSFDERNVIADKNLCELGFTGEIIEGDKKEEIEHITLKDFFYLTKNQNEIPKYWFKYIGDTYTMAIAQSRIELLNNCIYSSLNKKLLIQQLNENYANIPVEDMFNPNAVIVGIKKEEQQRLIDEEEQKIQQRREKEIEEKRQIEKIKKEEMKLKFEEFVKNKKDIIKLLILNDDGSYKDVNKYRCINLYELGFDEENVDKNTEYVNIEMIFPEIISEYRNLDFIYHSYLDITLEEMNFSVRTYNALKRAGVDTVQDILEKSEKELAEIRNLGERSLKEVIKKIEPLRLNIEEKKASIGNICQEIAKVCGIDPESIEETGERKTESIDIIETEENNNLNNIESIKLEEREESSYSEKNNDEVLQSDRELDDKVNDDEISILEEKNKKLQLEVKKARKKLKEEKRKQELLESIEAHQKELAKLKKELAKYGINMDENGDSEGNKSLETDEVDI